MIRDEQHDGISIGDVDGERLECSLKYDAVYEVSPPCYAAPYGRAVSGQRLSLSTFAMKLQPGICPFPALVLGLWGKNYHATRRYHGISPGFPRPLSVSKVPSEEQRNIGFSFILSVVM